MAAKPKVVALRDVHVAGVEACSEGSILRADDPLVEAVPDAFVPYARSKAKTK